MKVFAIGLIPFTAMFAIGLIFILAAIGRRKRRAQQYRPVNVAVPPALNRSSGRSSARSFVWGLAIALGFVAIIGLVGTQSVRMAPTNQAFVYQNIAPQGYAPQLIPMPAVDDMPPVPPLEEVQPVAPPAPVPHHKPAPWFKPNRQPTADTEPRWHATIPASTFPSVMSSRDKLAEAIALRLETDLHLHSAPPRAFVTNQQFIRSIKTESRILPEEDPVNGKVEVVTAEVELTHAGWNELARLERLDRSESRMIEVARGLGLFSILLGAIAAYVRLDELTKGYYSGRLFLLATLIVGGAGFAILHV